MKVKIVIWILVLMFSAFAGSVFGGTEDTYSTAYGLGTGSTAYPYEYNTFFGNYAGWLNIGIENTFLGYAAGSSNTVGSGNAFIGYAAGNINVNGSGDTFVGFSAGYSNFNGSGNTFLGSQAGYLNYSGSENTFIGSGAGSANNGNSNTFLGYNAGCNETGSNKLYIANSSTSTPLIYGEFDNKIVTVNGSLGIGTSTPVRYLHLSGSNAVFRMDRTTDTTAFQMVRTDSGGNPKKVFVVGTNYSTSTGLGEFVIWDNGTHLSGAYNRRMTIDNNGAVTFPGDVTVHTLYTSSSLTLKDNVRTYENALDTVNRLRGVSFDWKDSGKPSVGLIAEEVAKVVPEVVAYNDGAATGVNYASLVGVLVEAVKEQQAIVKELQDKNNRLEQRLLVLEGK